MDCRSFTASNVSRPVPFNTLSGVLSYMLSNVVDEAVSLTWNSARLFTAMAPIGPLTVRARLFPRLTARTGDTDL